jgi:hypothetical protein
VIGAGISLSLVLPKVLFASIALSVPVPAKQHGDPKQNFVLYPRFYNYVFSSHPPFLAMYSNNQFAYNLEYSWTVAARSLNLLSPSRYGSREMCSNHDDWPPSLFMSPSSLHCHEQESISAYKNIMQSRSCPTPLSQNISQKSEHAASNPRRVQGRHGG